MDTGTLRLEAERLRGAGVAVDFVVLGRVSDIGGEATASALREVVAELNSDLSDHGAGGAHAPSLAGSATAPGSASGAGPAAPAGVSEAGPSGEAGRGREGSAPGSR